MKATRINIRSLSETELGAWLDSQKESHFRVTQIMEWLWGKNVDSFDAMTNLPKSLREKLKENFEIRHLSVEKSTVSADGTIKSAYRLADGRIIEGVLIPTDRRITACISSQAGCSLNCAFCATAALKMSRNLGADEIFDQVVLAIDQAREHFQRPLTNVVFMGMGEPLLNYKNVVQALERLHARYGLAMGAHRFTLSTAGIVKMIYRLADDKLPCKLAVSLHSAIPEKRTRLMPINETNPLHDLRKALVYYTQKTGKPVTLEYLMLKDVNDLREDAEALVKFVRSFPSKINLIEYNPVDKLPFTGSDSGRIRDFQEFLKSKGLVTTLRRSRGKDIDAACGQLAGQLMPGYLPLKSTPVN